MKLTTSLDIYQNDILVGSKSNHPVVLAGNAALYRNGLTTLRTSQLQAYTLYLDISGLWNPIVTWYFNPNADKYAHTKPSKHHPNILEPTVERAVVESMAFHDYFDEGILIEAIQSYLFINNDNYQPLLEEAEFWKYKKEMVEYWVKEAQEFNEV